MILPHAVTIISLIAFVGLASVLAAGEAITYPASAGIIDAKAHGAIGDGVADDTAALQRALTDGVDRHQIVYLPPGTYLVRDTLRWKHANEDGPSHGWGRFLQLRGAGASLSIIRLAPASPGFADAAAPKAVISTGSSGSHGDKQYFNGEGNEAFMNHLRDFALEVGAGNPGAIGIAFQASNSAGMRDVAISAAKGSGALGIDLTRRDNGPGLITGVSITGFACAVRAAQEICQFTLEHVRIAEQREVGIDCRDAVFAVRKLESRNTVPALRVTGVGHCALLDATLTGGAAGGVAIACVEGDPRLLLRDVAVHGYGRAVDREGGPAVGAIPWYTSHPTQHAAGAVTPGKRIAVVETPRPPLPSSDGWVDVGPANGSDDSDAIAAAFAAGKPVVFLRRADYRIGRTLDVPGHVRWIIGLGTTFDLVGDRALADDAPVLRFVGGAKGDTTVVDAFWCGARGGTLVEHRDARSVVLRDIVTLDTRCYRNVEGCGPLFVEDCAGAGYSLAKGTRLFARQWNNEGPGEPKARIDGAMVWSLGFKHEGHESHLGIGAGSRVEAYGGFMYTFGVDQRPAFTVTDSEVLLSFAGTTYMPDGFYKTLIEDHRGVATHLLRADDAPGRGGGRSVVYLAPAGGR